jgi:hypothetical protein
MAIILQEALRGLFYAPFYVALARDTFAAGVARQERDGRCELGRADAQALADYDASLKVVARRPTALFGRGVVRRQKGDVSGGDADIAAATAIDATVVGQLARRGAVP